jgi:hypothetical protein
MLDGEKVSVVLSVTMATITTNYWTFDHELHLEERRMSNMAQQLLLAFKLQNNNQEIVHDVNR